jgi:hypothetical protein
LRIARARGGSRGACAQTIRPGRFAGLLGGLVAAIALAGCSGTTPADGAKSRYVNRAHRFEMDVPHGWIVHESGGPAVVDITAPSGKGGVRPSLNVVVETPYAGLALSDLVRTSKARLAALWGFAVEGEDGPVTLADGTRAWAITFRQAALGRPLAQRQLYVVAGERAYIVTATASPDAFAEDSKDFETCFRSFRSGRVTSEKRL